MKKKVFVVTLVVLVSFLLLADTSKAFENSVCPATTIITSDDN